MDGKLHCAISAAVTAGRLRSFWRVLGGVEADLGCRDSDEGCGVVAVVEAALVLSWFLEHLGRKSEVCSLAVPSFTKMATPTVNFTYWLLKRNSKEEFMSRSQIVILHNKVVRMYVHWTIHFQWYRHAYASFPMSYVRAMVIKPSCVPERRRKSQISAIVPNKTTSIDHHEDEGPNAE